MTKRTGVAEAAPVASVDRVLECNDLQVGHLGGVAVRDLCLHVDRGEIVVLLGPNGSGKTTTLLTLVGDLTPLGGEVRFDGELATDPLYLRSRRGLAFVRDEKSLVPSLSARDNLRVAGVTVEQATEHFPEIASFERRRAGLLSGGEQQMLTFARAFGRNPRLVVVDELSQGLAPIIADRLAVGLQRAAQQGVAVLVVEQSVHRALSMSDRFHVLRQGVVELTGNSKDYRSRPEDIEHLLAPAAAQGS